MATATNKFSTARYGKKRRPMTRDEYEAYHEYNTYTNDNDRD